MDVSQDHVEYTKFKPVWTRCDDAVDGQDAIKDKTTEYLPMLPGMLLAPDGNQLYTIYIENALWYPATGRTLSAYLGTMFRKPSTIEMPEQMQEAEEAFTPEGQPIDGFAVELARDVVKGYRPGVLVDYPDIDTDGMTQAQAEAAGARPYSILYPASSIVNWGQRLIEGHVVTVFVVLEEMMALPKAQEKYSAKYLSVNGYAKIRRVLELVNTEEGQAYRQKLYALEESSNSQGQEWRLVDTKTPTMNGAPLDRIPFIPVTTAGLVWDMKYPLINDLAVLNIADYRNEALYRDALLFNGRPTPCVSGLILDANQKSVALGSSNVLQFEEGGQWGTLGGGADAAGLKDSGNDLKQQMALVGSRALAEDPRGVEAAETAAIHRQGEDGILSSVANTVSDAITRALQIMAEWWSPPVGGDVSYQINTDFLPGQIDAARMTAAWTMYQGGQLSFDAFFSYLQRGEVYPAGWTKEDEMEALEAESDAVDVGLADIGGAANVEEAVQVATLSGIQIEAANTIIQSVATGALTREAAINQLVVFLGLARAQAEMVMAGVEAGASTAIPGEE